MGVDIVRLSEVGKKAGNHTIREEDSLSDQAILLHWDMEVEG